MKTEKKTSLSLININALCILKLWPRSFRGEKKQKIIANLIFRWNELFVYDEYAHGEDYLNLDLMIIAIINKLFMELMNIIAVSTLW